MRASGISNLRIPVIYVNPYFNTDYGLMKEVIEAGAMGVVDHATAGASPIELPSNLNYGVRCNYRDLSVYGAQPNIRLAILPLTDIEDLETVEPGRLSGLTFPVFVEVGSAEHAQVAERAGAGGLIARGSEGPGWVSETNGFVLLQKLLRSSGLPTFLQGGVCLRTAAGTVRAGASGVVLDNHLLLTESSNLSEGLKKFLSGLALPTTATLGEDSPRILRVYSRVGTKIVRELRKVEDSLTHDEWPSYYFRLNTSIGNPSNTPDTDETLLPLSEDIITAKSLASRYRTASEIIAEFGLRMQSPGFSWPFSEGSDLCKEHGTRYPVVQGPMAHVSDNAEFLGMIANGGALPFLALGNMPGPIAKEAMDEAREKTGDQYGVGLMGLDVNAYRYEAHLQLMSKTPPKFAILAAGGPDLAKRIEALGVKCYLHCPAPAVLSDGIKAGLRRFVFEGNESGGHIGNLSSLSLWSANLEELARKADAGLDLNEVSILFAGGIASPHAAAFLAGMVGDLTSKGLKTGLQMGTVYLTCDEAVRTNAITDCYQRLTLENSGTVVIGRTVNIKARAAGSPMASMLITREHDRLRNGVSLRERKELYEKDNLGALRLASKGCAIDPATANSECPVFCDLSEEDQLERGLYLMGQGVCLLEQPTSIEEIHQDIFIKGSEIFEMENPSNLAAKPLSVPERSSESNSGSFTKESTELPVVGRGSEGFDQVASNPSQELADQSQQTQVFEMEPSGNSAMEYDSSQEPIAVVGIGLRLPGADSPESLWKYIIGMKNGIIKAPAERWKNIDYYYDPDPKVPDKTYSCIGGFITDFQFDPLKFRIPPSVAKKMDRTQQLAVSCVADALEDAGLKPEQLKGKRVGIVIGNSMGGETTDRYAERLSLPRALDVLTESFDKAGLDQATKAAAIENFRQRYLEGLPEITEDSLPGELPNVIAGRVANVFNLEGPNFTVDAACASSLAAIMNAANGLRSGSMDMALAGGVDAAMHPSSFIKFCKVGALSADGSRPFDEGANGFIMGEGAGIMLMKRLSDAVSDGDRIYGLILGVGSSSDGRGKGITAPNAAGQERAIRACLQVSGIDPRTIGLIEAHGTSTPVGDKTELALLDKFFREAGLPAGSVGIGSIKSQIGHLKAGAGAAGIIKALLALYHRTLPPTINIRKPNPCIDWNDSPLKLLTDAQPWKANNGSPRRAGVSAFGFGGTNFHVALQEFSPDIKLVPRESKVVAKKTERIDFVAPRWPKPLTQSIEGEAWAIGGNSPEDIERKVKRILSEINPGNFRLLAASARKDVTTFQSRFGFGATDPGMAVKKLETILEVIQDPKKKVVLPARGISFAQAEVVRLKPGAAFLFPGQGSQYPFMLRDLSDRFPVVAETFAEADEILQELGLPSIISTVFPDDQEMEKVAREGSDPLRDTQILQPMILTADTAMLRLLQTMGIRPVACAGHSLGEYAACVGAGVFSFRDALEAVAVRGREMARVSIADPGLMMSIPADARLVEEALAEVEGYVVAANKNSPRQTVISGETKAVIKAGELFKSRGLEGILVPVSAAFHSGVVAPAREPFMRTLEKLEVNPPTTPILSNVTGDFYPVGPAAPDRIRDLLGKQFAAPVEWVKTLRKMYSEGIRVFIECGPKRVMTNLTLDTLSSDALALPMNHPKKGGILQLMESLAALMIEGFDVNMEAAELYSVKVPEQVRRPELRVVRSDEPVRALQAQSLPQPVKLMASPLDMLLDDDLKKLATDKVFVRYLEMQGAPIRALLKTGYQSFVDTILPLEQTVQTVKSEGMDFDKVVISGISAGLPSDVRFAFDKDNLDDLILGKNFIKQVPEFGRVDMLEKNVERLYKGPDGEADLRTVDDISGVIHLAGFFNDAEIAKEYGLDDKLVTAMDVTTRLAVAAGLEALRDAGIPLVRQMKRTSAGTELPDSWALPTELRAETGVIFASAFPGMASLVDEVTRETAAKYGAGAKKRLIDFYTGLVERIRDDRERERVTKWFTQEFSKIAGSDEDDLYTFNRTFLLRVMSMAHGQLAQLIKAQGPNTHVDAACAGTTQAILVGRDWIRTGQAKRVLIIAADDVAGQTLLPWIGSGFLAMGAATTNANLSEAALPFDDRRHGLILGSAAVGVVLEKEQLTRQRGMESVASIEAGAVANSGFHGTRLDVNHISSVMEGMISKWEKQSGMGRDELARKLFFMSHETYSPKRGGSADAEIKALRNTFGEHVNQIPIANTKGFTGHTMGVGVEDVVSIRCLQKGLLPPIPNLRNPDPDFEDLNLSRGGKCEAEYALRLAAGFGSQIVMSLYRVNSHEENRITDLPAHRDWLRKVTGYDDPVMTVEDRTLKVSQRAGSTTRVKTEKNVEVVTEPVELSPAKTVAVERNYDQIKTEILALLSEKTGYPADMLDTGLDLEADLGIDTVKQAEFITEVREKFEIPRIDGLKIAEFPTIDHIINFVLSHSSQQSGEPQLQVSSAGHMAIDATAVQGKILALLSEKTGYPAEMLDVDLDLEADLGIDTVKQAEFITEVRESFDIPRIDGLKIADFPTIKHIIGFVLSHSASKTGEEQSGPVVSGSLDATAVQGKILALLSEKTGYPAEMLDVDLDLEADLGIDTVKQAEFITEVREAFGIPRIDGLKIADFPTIKHIIGFVLESGQVADSLDEVAVTPAHSDKPDAQKGPEIKLYESRLVALPELPETKPPLVDRFVIISRQSPLAERMSKDLVSEGYSDVITIHEISQIGKLASERTGIINLLGMSCADDLDRTSFELFLELARLFENGPAALLTVVQEDGAYGFRNPAPLGYKTGALVGAAKSFAKEYPDTFSRVLDLNPSLDTEAQSRLIMKSLVSDYPVETATNEQGGLEAIRFAEVGANYDRTVLNSGDVILVTGGARGITAECLKKLSSSYSLTYVLMGRTPQTEKSEAYARYGKEEWLRERDRVLERMKREGVAPTPVKVEKELSRMRGEGEVFRNISELREMGSEVMYRSLDILDEKAVDEFIRDVATVCGRVDMIIHGAGLDVSKALKSKTFDQIELVYNVKVQGIRNVLDSLERFGLPPKRIISFGSVSGRFGNIAQLDYSAANDSLAHMMRFLSSSSDVRATIIDWAPWSEIGMAVRGSVQDTLESAGIDFIPPQVGAELLERELFRVGPAVETLAAGKLGPFGADAFEISEFTKEQDLMIGGQKATVQELVPGERVRIKILLDPTHPLLDHHRINRAAVFPGVGGLELMRGAYQVLNPEGGNVTFSYVRYLQPLKVFKNDPFQAEIEVVREDGTESADPVFKARITSILTDKEGRPFGDTRVHHECRLQSIEQAVPEWPESEIWSQSLFVPYSEIYAQFFHGPAFRLIDHCSIEGSWNAIRFRYRDTDQRPDMFSDVIPAAVEAVFQAVAAFGMESHSVMALPIGIEKAIIHKTDSVPREGELIRSEVFTASTDEERSRFKFDGWIKDHEGNVMASLYGVEMIELEPKDKFVGKLHEATIEIGSLIPDEMSFESEEILRHLTAEEIAEAKSKSTPKRQKEWVSGRIALKKSLKRLMEMEGMGDTAATDIRIFQDELGKPIAEYANQSGKRIGSVSLTHSNGLAMAAAASTKHFAGFGIDIEKVEQRSESWVKDYFDESEILLSGDGPERWRNLNAIWSLKEACLKALGVGLRFDLREIVVSELDSCGKATIEFRNKAGEAVDRLEFSQIEAWVEINENLVVSRAFLRN